MKKKRKWKQVKFCQFEHHEQESKTTVYNNIFWFIRLADCEVTELITEVQRKILMIYDQNVAIITNKADNKNVVLIF